jgi:hypothetical protein
MAPLSGIQRLDQDAAASLWRHTLAQIPTLFGRLVYLSSLRNQNSGQYEHFGLAQRFGMEQAGEAIRATHRDAFREWLCLDLERQREEVGQYLESLDTDRKQAVETWVRLAPHRNFVPSDANPVEQDLYLQDFSAVLYLLRNEYGVPCPDPDA